MIYTSYFANYHDHDGVSIARITPHWFNGSDVYQALTPDYKLLRAYKEKETTWKEYRIAYIKQLKALDVHKVYNELNGRVLLCYERLETDPDKPKIHCHRHIVREWFIRNGYECEELPIRAKGGKA